MSYTTLGASLSFGTPSIADQANAALKAATAPKRLTTTTAASRIIMNAALKQPNIRVNLPTGPTTIASASGGSVATLLVGGLVVLVAGGVVASILKKKST
jgi:hypothetical protein